MCARSIGLPLEPGVCAPFSSRANLIVSEGPSYFFLSNDAGEGDGGGDGELRSITNVFQVGTKPSPPKLNPKIDLIEKQESQR